MKTVELTGVCGAARDYFKGLLSLGLEVLATYTEKGDHWAGGLRKQNLTKSPLSTVDFISTKGRDGRKTGKNGPSAESRTLTL